MPRENALGLIAAKDRDDFALLMAAFRANGRTLGGVVLADERPRPTDDGIRLARTSGEHAAGATQSVDLCDTDFVRRLPLESVDTINDSGVSLPDDTKILIQRIAGKTRVIQAFLCTG